jgi:hypothetical protein
MRIDAFVVMQRLKLKMIKTEPGPDDNCESEEDVTPFNFLYPKTHASK